MVSHFLKSGHQPSILVWDVVTGQLLSECKGHKFGVSCLAFSPNMKYLVSVGYQHDGYLFFWDWKANTPLAANKTSEKLYSISFAEDGTYFVTAGERHMKFWFLDASGNVKKTDKVCDFAHYSDIIYL